jgi:hypothetical protein
VKGNEARREADSQKQKPKEREHPRIACRRAPAADGAVASRRGYLGTTSRALFRSHHRTSEYSRPLSPDRRFVGTPRGAVRNHPNPRALSCKGAHHTVVTPCVARRDSMRQCLGPELISDAVAQNQQDGQSGSRQSGLLSARVRPAAYFIPERVSAYMPPNLKRMRHFLGEWTELSAGGIGQ